MDDRILRMSKRELRQRVIELEEREQWNKRMEAAPIVMNGRLLTFSYSMESDYMDNPTFNNMWKVVSPPQITFNAEFHIDSSQFSPNVFMQGKYKVNNYQIILKEMPHGK
jgi:hypothetical protein